MTINWNEFCKNALATDFGEKMKNIIQCFENNYFYRYNAKLLP